MSIMMVLEADNRLTKDQMIATLRSSGVLDISEVAGKLKGEFKESGISFVCNDAGSDNYVVAEGFVKLNWKISKRIIFHYVKDEFEKCSIDLHNFLNILCDKTSANFVLSFQYEGFYAIRDEKGFELLQNF